MKIYLAGPFRRQAALRGVRARIERETPHRVISSWLDEQEADPVSYAWPRVASRDLEEIQAANLLILETLEQGEQGGYDVEFGFALGFMRRAWIVGPQRNVFHSCVETYPAWDDALLALR